MPKILFLVDPGHGDFLNGKNYSKQGKYSPKFLDGNRFYEGHNNRDNARRLIGSLITAGLDTTDVTKSSPEDVPLKVRTDYANQLCKTRPGMFISIHSDAIGNGEEWQPASGVSVYTSPGQTQSDSFATLLIENLKKQLGTDVKWRQDNADGDPDKEESFHVLRETHMPAVLIEAGFHTNKEEVKLIMSEPFKDKLIKAITDTCVKWQQTYA